MNKKKVLNFYLFSKIDTKIHIVTHDFYIYMYLYKIFTELLSTLNIYICIIAIELNNEDII